MRHLIEAKEERQRVATEITLASGVVKGCPYHETLLRGKAEVNNAYKEGNRRFTNGTLHGTFSTRQEMTDAIQDVLTADVHESCYSCQRIEED